MRNEVARDLTTSANAMQAIVWSEIAPFIGGGEYFPIESTTVKGLHKTLDSLAGIDAFQITDDLIRGLGTRVQPIKEGVAPWDTFTYRFSRSTGAQTEYYKRHKAIVANALYPQLTIHAYVSPDSTQVLSVCAVDTRQLCEYLQKNISNPKRVQIRTVKCDSNRFLVVHWDQLAKDGLDIQIVRKPTGVAV